MKTVRQDRNKIEKMCYSEFLNKWTEKNWQIVWLICRTFLLLQHF